MDSINKDLLIQILTIGFDALERGFKDFSEWSHVMLNDLEKSHPDIKINLHHIFNAAAKIQNEIYTEDIENLDPQQFIIDYMEEDPNYFDDLLDSASDVEVITDLFSSSLEKIRQKLLDLTKRNRLINYKESKRSIRIINAHPDQVFDSLIQEGKKMEFLPLPEVQDENPDNGEGERESEQQPLLKDEPSQDVLDIKIDGSEEKTSTNPIITGPDIQEKNVLKISINNESQLITQLEINTLERRCKKLMYESKTAIEETGSNFLHLAIGFLEWYESPDSSELYRAPLVLVPVNIERTKLDKDTNCYSYAISYIDEDIETNLSLTEKLDHDFDLILPDFSDEISPEQYFMKVNGAIEKHKRWKVADDIVLGLFSFAKILMYKDLDPQRWPASSSLRGKSNLHHILLGKEEPEENSNNGFGEPYDINKDPRADEVPIVLDADSYQHSAIIDVLSENENLVIEGPPGTGKSQTITNLICAALNEGKTVLFLAEKKAALDVVRSRLDHIGLGDFCLELHSHKSRKSQILFDLKMRLGRNFKDPERLDFELKDFKREKAKLVDYSNSLKKSIGPNSQPIHEIFWAAERYRVELEKIPPRLHITNPLNLNRDEVLRRKEIIEDYVTIRKELPLNVIKYWDSFALKNYFPDDGVSIKEDLTNILKLVRAYENYLNNCKSEHDYPFSEILVDIGNLTLLDRNILNNPPKDIQKNICLTCLTNDGVDLIEKFIHSINECRNFYSEAFNVLSEADPSLIKNYKELLDSTQILVDKGYDKKSQVDLETVLEIMLNAEILINNLQEQSSLYENIFLEIPLTIEDYQKLSKFFELIASSPPEVLNNIIPEHTSEQASEIFRKAFNISTKLKEKLKLFEEYFDTTAMPSLDVIKSLSNKFKDMADWPYCYIRKHNRNAIRQLKNISNQKNIIKTKGLYKLLNNYSTIIKNIEMFKSDHSNVESVGDLYKGVDSDWDLLEKIFSWSVKLNSITESPSVTKHIVKNLNDYVSAISLKTEKIPEILSEIVNLLSQIYLQNMASNNIEEILKYMNNRKIVITNNKRVLTKYTLSKSIAIGQIHNAITSYASAHYIETTMNENQFYSEIFGVTYKGIDTELDSIQENIKWIRSLVKFDLDEVIIKWILDDATDGRLNLLIGIIESSAQFTQLLEKYTQSLLSLTEETESDVTFLNSSNGFLGRDNDKTSLATLKSNVDTCLNTINYLSAISEYYNINIELHQVGLEKIAELVDTEMVSLEDCVNYYFYSLYDSIGMKVIRENEELSGFSRAKYENVIGRFVELDKSIMTNIRERIAHNTSQRKIPIGESYGRVRDFTELSLIKQELSKKKRHIPIRQLVRRATKALMAMKPCFMMSPLSVSQYLVPGEIEFDLLVMDEASQIKPEDALGAIARAHQIVVVGDPNQLPPTSFFQRFEGETYDEDATAIEHTESILDICLTNYRKRRLIWHYRSEHESLIAFSNNQFYDDELIVFPSPYRNNEHYGIRHHFIEGAKYRRRRNRLEAVAVASAVKDMFINEPEVSLGVATINRDQRDLIQDELERIFKVESWLEQKIRATETTEEPFFIKNLENVQGDERDVIFISTTYGPDQDTGRVFQRFGPISGEMGWRRLNVLFTRAKKRIEIFTSMKSSDIHLTETSSRGAHALKLYLNYAETGSIPELGDFSGREPDSDFEIAVSKMINNLGYRTEPQVGVAGYFIDIGVKHPERDRDFILGVECDGASYHSAKSVRDRDRLRQEVLEKKGWKIHRIWSTDFFKNRDREIERLKTVLGDIIVSEISVAEPEIHDDGVDHLLERYDLSTEDRISEFERLKQELVLYRKTNIDPSFPDYENSILREEILEYFINRKPVTRDDFYKSIPIELREETDPIQLQYLDDIFEIIEEYVD